jgi:predicted RNA-binding protein YlxR (DUF448 family)
MAAHVPERMCIACRTRRPQRELIRLARRDGTVEIDAGRHRAGRGAYLCRRTACVTQAMKRQALRRALGGEMAEATAAALWQAACGDGDRQSD